MAELNLTDAEKAALYGAEVLAGTGITLPAYERNWGGARHQTDDRLARVAMLANALRVYEIEGNADAVGVRPGRCTIAGTALDYAGEDPAVDGLTDDDTTYVWAYDDTGTLTIDSAVDGTGWPATDHLKLAEVTMASGVITGIVDRRADAMLAVGQAAARADSTQDALTLTSVTTTVTDPADTPADADALRDDLVTNALAEIETALGNLSTRDGELETAVETLATEFNDLLTKLRAAGVLRT